MTTTSTSPVPVHNDFKPFDDGERGRVHAQAHDLMDEGRYREAYDVLQPFLADDTSLEPRAVHLQWHLAVVEIALGKLADAKARFERFIMPAVPASDALTDAPSLMWRLLLSDASSGHDWRPIAAAARRPENPEDPYVELHEALALAGAGDLRSLDRWLDEQLERASCEKDFTLLRLAWGLRCFASQDYGVSERLLADGDRQATRLGGSRAQNEVFKQIQCEASKRGRALSNSAAAA